MKNNYNNLSSIIQELQYIDTKQAIGLISPFILFIIINKINNNDLITYKDNLLNNEKIYIEPKPNINYKELNNNPIFISDNDYKLITIFINTIKEYFNDKDLSILNYNLNDLQILDIEKINNLHTILSKNTTATYDTINNTIYLNKDKTSTIFHELFHVASSYYDNDKKIIYSGFSQINYKKSIGKGITEGYTQLLTEKYFKEKYNILKSYTYEKGITKNIEDIIGPQYMKELYITADLKGLINTLNNYIDSNNIYKFIHNIDFIMQHINQENKNNYINNIITKKLKEVNIFLLDTYINKLLDEYKKSIISLNEFYDKLKKYLLQIPTTITTYDTYYKINTIDELIKLSKHIKKKKLIKY